MHALSAWQAALAKSEHAWSAETAPPLPLLPPEHAMIQTPKAGASQLASLCMERMEPRYPIACHTTMTTWAGP